MLNILDLFSGIGGFSVGLEATGGFRTVAFCEQNEYATRVLGKHWPRIPVFPDVRTLDAASLAGLGAGRIDVVCGGFPCQDISLAGTGGGLNGARSGLWFEMLRVITEVRPAWVIIENVSALRSRGLDTVLGGLASIGYDAEWHCIPASAVGAPHRRDRIWVVAYPNGNAGNERRSSDAREGAGRRDADRGSIGADVADTDDGGRNRRTGNVTKADRRNEPPDSSQSVADPNGPRLEIKLHGEAGEQPTTERTHAWSVEPDVARVAYGVSSRVDRITALGNAVVPQIPYLIGQAILRSIAVY